MNADDVRRIMRENLKGPVIEKFVDAIDEKIKHTAKEGKNGIDPWLHLGSLRMPGPAPGERQAIKEHYVAQGFTWRDHPDPDPGHPASRPYTTLSW